MRGVLLAVSLLAGCGRIGFSDEPRTPGDVGIDGPPGLVAHLAFEDDPVDGADGVIGGAGAHCMGPCPTTVPGRLGNGYHFDGTQALALDDRPSLRTMTGTIALWVRFDQLPTGGAGASLLTKAWATAIQNSYELYVHENEQGVMRVTGGADAGGDSYASEDWTDGTGTWVHLALTWDPTGGFHLYRNAALVSSSPGYAMTFDAHPLTIGADINNELLAAFAVATFDEVYVYERVLSQTEITALAQ